MQPPQIAASERRGSEVDDALRPSVNYILPAGALGTHLLNGGREDNHQGGLPLYAADGWLP